MAELAARARQRTDDADHHPKHPAFPGLVEVRFGHFMIDGAEPVEAAEVVHAVRPSNLTAIDSLRFDLSERADHLYEVRTHIRSFVVAGVAMIVMGAPAGALLGPPYEPHSLAGCQGRSNQGRHLGRGQGAVRRIGV
jgi:hypothetical protein